MGITAALLGYINPLVAAILMPLSSTAVVLSTIYGTKDLRALKKEKNNELLKTKMENEDKKRDQQGVGYKEQTV